MKISTGDFVRGTKKFDRTEALQLLKDGHKDALQEYNLRGADLYGADMRGADLSGADMTGAILSEADMRWANLSGVDLTYANLSGVDLTDANLSGADLTGAILTNAILTGADMRGAKLKEADMTGARIDYSGWPLWCGSLRVKADARLAAQLAYHLCSLDCDDPEFVEARNSLLPFANRFHRKEMPRLKPVEACVTTDKDGGVTDGQD